MGDIPAMTRTELLRERDDALGKLSRVEAEIEGIKSELAGRLNGVQGDAQRLRSTIGQLEGEIARREAQDRMVPTISDHALLRYIERLCGVNVEALKAELLTTSVIAAIKSGATGLKTPLGTMVIKGSTVVTFLSADMRPKAKTKRGLARQHDEGDDEVNDAHKFSEV